jgi:manganese/zinc/iron transport system substrate-binding protein
MIGDAVKNIVKGNYEVITLMGPGVDPHLYKATQGDLKSLNRADIIVYNGLHLEGKMGEIFEKLSNRKHIIVASDAIPVERLINNTEFQGAHDPHLWFDVQLWSDVVLHINNEITAFNPELKQELFENALPYYENLLSLDKKVKDQIAQLDSNKRVLITAHDAFGYFGRAYGFEVKGLQGISTVSEYGLKDVSNLVNFISEREIKAVFVESSVSDRSLKAVTEGCKAKGHDVKIGGTLFSDAMGEETTEEGTYIGMVKYNVKTIVGSLN